MPGRVIAIGEALVEVMRPAGGAPLDQAGTFLGPFPSGAPAIFAVAARRLGAEVGFIGCVGKDGFGRMLTDRLFAEGVDTSQVQVNGDLATAVAFVAYTSDGSREFIFHLRQAAAGGLDPERIGAEYFQGTDWLHLSGSTLALNENSREACRRALEFTRQAGGKLSLDPNLRPELMAGEQARQVFGDFLPQAEVLLPTAVEAHELTGLQDDDRAAQMLLTGRVKVVVFKRGAAGCSLFTREGRIDVAGFGVEEVDPTGAGDCFNAAFLRGMQVGWSLERTARYANAAGALAVTRQGPMEGASGPEDILILMDRIDG